MLLDLGLESKVIRTLNEPWEQNQTFNMEGH